MALTKSDFSQIKNIVRDSVKPLDSRLKNVETNVKSIDSRLKTVETNVKQTKRTLIIVDKNIKKIKKDTKLIVEVFDDEYLKLKAHVERIEKFLKITPLTNL